MQCPKCHTELIPRAIETVTVDECGGCEGIWFEKEELRMVKDATDPDLNWMDFEIWGKPEALKVSGTRSQCPRCAVSMHVLDYDDTGVEVEYCDQCSGVWLDKGKLGTIIDALERELLDKSLGDYVKETLGEAKELLIGPESFVSEWKDFATVVRLLQYRLLSLRPEIAKKIVLFQRNPFNI